MCRCLNFSEAAVIVIVVIVLIIGSLEEDVLELQFETLNCFVFWWDDCLKHFIPCSEQTPQGPFGQSQQLSNSPSTVLISSTSNSLMSASVKPSTQQIGAIGTKGAGPYQQSALPSAPQASQVYAGVLCAFTHYSLHQTVVPRDYSWLPKKCNVTLCSWDSASFIIYVVLKCLYSNYSMMAKKLWT